MYSKILFAISQECCTLSLSLFTTAGVMEINIPKWCPTFSFFMKPELEPEALLRIT